MVKKLMQKILIVILLLLVLQNISCKGREVTKDNPVNMDFFIGKWEYDNKIYIFNKDSTLTKKGTSIDYGKWEVDNNRLFIREMGWGNENFKVTRIGDDFFQVKRQYWLSDDYTTEEFTKLD